MRPLVLVIAAIGFAVFGTVFARSYASQSFVETVGKEVIRLEVQRQVAEKVEALDGSRLAGLAERLSGRNAEELATARRRLAEGLPAKVAETVARMRSLDCECRRAIERRMTGLLEGRVATLANLNKRLALLIRTKYMETAERLTREFRIFSGVNAMVFGILGAVTLLRRKANLQLVLPTLVLLGAAGLTAYFYLFQQDWLHTILFSEYVGLGYFAYFSLASAVGRHRLQSSKDYHRDRQRGRQCVWGSNTGSPMLKLPPNGFVEWPPNDGHRGRHSSMLSAPLRPIHGRH